MTGGPRFCVIRKLMRPYVVSTNYFDIYTDNWHKDVNNLSNYPKFCVTTV